MSIVLLTYSRRIPRHDHHPKYREHRPTGVNTNFKMLPHNISLYLLNHKTTPTNLIIGRIFTPHCKPTNNINTTHILPSIASPLLPAPANIPYPSPHTYQPLIINHSPSTATSSILWGNWTSLNVADEWLPLVLVQLLFTRKTNSEIIASFSKSFLLPPKFLYYFLNPVTTSLSVDLAAGLEF